MSWKVGPAEAWHHRSDAFSSMLVLLGVLCRVFVHSAFDPIAGAFLSSVILRVSWGIGRRAVSELLDMQLPEQESWRKGGFSLGFHGFSWVLDGFRSKMSNLLVDFCMPVQVF